MDRVGCYKFIIGFLSLVIVSGCLALNSRYGHAQVQTDPGANVFLDALEAMDKKLYDEAESLLLKAIELSPANLEYSYHLGLLKMLKGDYGSAISILSKVVETDPQNFLKAFLDIGSIHIRQKKYSAAEAVFLEAKRYHEKNGRFNLEYASLLKDMGRYQEALDYIERSMQYDETLHQSAFLLKGVVLLEMSRFEEAQESLKSAIEINPESPSANLAKDLVKSIPAIKRAKRPLYALLNLSWTYDDNVALEPLEDISKKGLTTQKSDYYETINLKAGYRILKTKDAELSFGYGLYNVGYKDKVENNIFAHVPFFSFAYNFEKFEIILPYEYYYFRTGGRDSYQDTGLFLTFGRHSERKLKMHSFSPLISIPIKNSMRAEFFSAFQIKEYLDQSPDAKLYSFGFIQSFLTDKKISPRLGIKYTKEDSESDHATYNSWELIGGVSMHFPYAFIGTINASYVKTKYDYNDPNLFPQWYSKRKDKLYTLTFGVSKNFLNYITLYCNYIYTHNDSNAIGYDIYKYEKNILNVGTTINF